MAVPHYRVNTIKTSDSTKKYDLSGAVIHKRSQRRGLLLKIGQTMFELVRRILNIDVFMKNLVRAATDLVESRLFRRQRIAFQRTKMATFEI